MNFGLKAKIMSELLNKQWSILIDQHSTLNKSSIFSYEVMANFGYHVCSLFSKLMYNPALLVENSTKEMKNLIDMIENYALTTHVVINSNHQSNIEDHCHSVLVRLKFLELLMKDQELGNICEKNLNNFQFKTVNLIIFAFINSTSTPAGSKDFFDLKDSNTSQCEIVLSSLINLCVNKIDIFKELNLKFNSDIENFLIDFISRYGQKLKNIQVFLKFSKFFNLYILIFP